MDRGDSYLSDLGMRLPAGPEPSMVQGTQGVRNTPKKKDYYGCLGPTLSNIHEDATP